MSLSDLANRHCLMTRAIAAILVVASNLLAAEGEISKWEQEVTRVETRNRGSAREGVVFYGSSSIRLWNLAESFPNERFVNAGFGGSTIADCTHFAPRLVTVHEPGTVVFYAGDNDIAAGRSAAQVRDDFAAFVAVIHGTLPRCRILFIAVKPSLRRWEKRAVQAEANRLVAEACSRDGRLVYVDVAAPMLGADGRPAQELFVPDGLHLSPRGYELWTGLVRAALARLPPADVTPAPGPVPPTPHRG